MARGIRNQVCANMDCKHQGEAGEGNIVPHGFFKSKAGKRRRYRCTSCGRTFSSNTGTPYHGIPKKTRPTNAENGSMVSPSGTGGRLRSRNNEAQATEVKLAVKVLNRMFELGAPLSEPILN